MSTINLKPALGRACPFPENPGELLPSEGAEVPRNTYWLRRVQDGDALEHKVTDGDAIEQKVVKAKKGGEEQ